MKRLFISIKEFLFKKKQTQKSVISTEKKVSEKPFEFPLKIDEIESQIVEEKNEKMNFGSHTFERQEKSEKRKSEDILLSEKEKWVYEYLKNNGDRYISPTEVGRNYGINVRNRRDYNSGHSRAVLLKLVSFKLATTNSESHYKYNHLKKV